MANEIHGRKAFLAATATLIDFGVEEGKSHDILVSSYALWANNDVCVQEDGTANALTSHPIPANTYISHAIPCRSLSIIGFEGKTGVVYWKAIPMQGVDQVSDVEVEEYRGGIHC